MRSAAMTPDPTSELCTWCGAAVDRDDGYRVREDPGARHAVFCRLEHVVPWAMQGAHWEAADPEAPAVGRRPWTPAHAASARSPTCA